MHKTVSGSHWNYCIHMGVNSTEKNKKILVCVSIWSDQARKLLLKCFPALLIFVTTPHSIDGLRTTCPIFYRPAKKKTKKKHGFSYIYFRLSCLWVDGLDSGMHNSNGPAGRNRILGSGRGPDSGFPPPPKFFRIFFRKFLLTIQH